MTGRTVAGVEIRLGEPEDRVGVSRVLDGAGLVVADLPGRLEAGEVLVAVSSETVVGTLVVATDGSIEPADPGGPPPERWSAGTHVRAITVLRRRRDRGVGSALLAAGVDRFGPLLASFDERARPFYEAIDARIEVAADDRYWALIETV